MKRGPKRPLRSYEAEVQVTLETQDVGEARAMGHIPGRAIYTQCRWPKREAFCDVRGRAPEETRGCTSPLERR